LTIQGIEVKIGLTNSKRGDHLCWGKVTTKFPERRGGRYMARFIVIHSAPSNFTQDQVINGAKRVIASLAPETEWLNSWVVPEVEKLFCEWEAPDADAIRASLEPIKDLFPVETIYAVEWMDPQWYQ
jgi:hypothetical protein